MSQITQINPRQFAIACFPEVSIDKVEFIAYQLQLTGNFLWYGQDQNQPLIHGYGQLRINSDSCGFVRQGCAIRGETSPQVGILRSKYYLKELELSERWPRQKILEEQGKILADFSDDFSLRFYRFTDESMNYAIRHFAGQAYLDRGRFPLGNGGIYLDGRWVYFPEEATGYLGEFKKIHACFATEENPFTSGLPDYLLVLETDKQELVFYSIAGRGLEIEFEPMTAPEA